MESNMCSNELASRTSVRHSVGVTRTRVRWGRVGALLASIVLTLCLGGSALGGAAHPGEERTRPRVLVEPGTTLWSIARDRVGQEEDPRPYIEEIRELNGLAGAELQVGQILLLP